eukprot:361556-Chlamydomonas_euryale.AAC.10
MVAQRARSQHATPRPCPESASPTPCGRAQPLGLDTNPSAPGAPAAHLPPAFRAQTARATSLTRCTPTSPRRSNLRSSATATKTAGWRARRTCRAMTSFMCCPRNSTPRPRCARAPRTEGGGGGLLEAMPWRMWGELPPMHSLIPSMDVSCLRACVICVMCVHGRSQHTYKP